MNLTKENIQFFLLLSSEDENHTSNSEDEDHNNREGTTKLKNNCRTSCEVNYIRASHCRNEAPVLKRGMLNVVVSIFGHPGLNLKLEENKCEDQVKENDKFINDTRPFLCKITM